MVTPTPRRLRIEVGLAPLSDDNLYAGFDGVEGVFVATHEPVGIGASVSIALHLPGGATVEAAGVVAWTRLGGFGAAPGVGVRFLDPLPPGERELLDIFAAYRAPLFYG